MPEDQHALWDILDSFGIPYNVPAATLLDQFGPYDDGWRTHGQIGPQDLIANLSTPLIFQTGTHISTVLPPAEFTGYLRDSEDWEHNFNALVQAATARFGPGRMGGVSNTKEAHWAFGDATVMVRTFPPAQNTKFGSNNRHSLIQNSAFEATCILRPNWCKPATDQVKQWIKQCDMIHPISSISFKIHDVDFDVPDLETTNGFGLTQDGAALIKFDPKRVAAIPTEQIRAVRYDRLLPARGGGGAYLSVSYDDANEVDKKDLQFLFSYDPDDIPQVRRLADDLAKRLAVPLRTSEAYDC